MRLDKSLISNFSWLAASQGANFVIPLVIYPYLIRVIDVEKFGLVVFSQAVIAYFINIVDYGFSITAVREVSIYRNNSRQLSAILTKLYLIKILLCLICFVVFITCIYLIPEWKSEKTLFLSSFIMVIGQLILPIWFFQGLEKMKGVAIMNFCSKGITLILILTLIEEANDYSFVNAYLGIGQMLVGLTALVIIIARYNITLLGISLNKIKSQLLENSSIFLSNFSVFVSNNSNLMILGLIADPVSVGYYGIVDKVLLAFRAPAVLLYQTTFPRACALAEYSFNSLKHFFSRIGKLIYLAFIPFGVLIYIYSDYITFLFAGKYIPEVSGLLKLVSFIPFLAAINIPATQTLLAYNLKKSYVKVTVTSAIVNVVLNIILATLIAAKGTAIAALSTEAFLVLGLYIYLAIRHKSYAMHRILKPF